METTKMFNTDDLSCDCCGCIEGEILVIEKLSYLSRIDLCENCANDLLSKLLALAIIKIDIKEVN